MIDENVTRKQLLYRSASTEALVRERDVLAFEALKPAKGMGKKRDPRFDVRATLNKE